MLYRKPVGIFIRWAFASAIGGRRSGKVNKSRGQNNTPSQVYTGSGFRARQPAQCSARGMAFRNLGDRRRSGHVEDLDGSAG